MSFDRTRLPDPLDYYQDQGLTIAKRGNRGWRTTNCPFCDSRDNGNINLESGGYHCWGCVAKGGDVVAFHMALHGKDFVQAAKDLGAWVEDGKPAQRTRPMPVSYKDALSAIAHEGQLIAVAAASIGKGKALPTEDLNRVLQAAGRINRLLGACHV